FNIANRAAFHSLLQKLRASSNRSLTTAPRGRAVSSGFSAHCVRNGFLHFVHSTRGSTRFFFVCSTSALQCGHSKSTGICTSCVSVVRYAKPNRRESAPNLSITSKGSTPFPFDFDIVSPKASRILG